MTLDFEILRPDDLLELKVTAVNLRLDTTNPASPRIVRDVAGQDAYLVFGFAPQSIIERAFFETGDPASPSFNQPPPNPPPTPPPGTEAPTLPGATGRRMAGSSRLVFRVPATVSNIPFTIEGLLDWSKLEAVLPPAALVEPDASSVEGGAPPPIAAPSELETALELPYRLIIAPNVNTGGAQPAWTHATSPVVASGRAELWHTRLGRRHGKTIREASEASPLPVRVVWSPDFVADGPLPSPDEAIPPFRAAMTVRDRDQIVILNVGFSGYTLTDESGNAQPYVPAPIEASTLFLSSLGAWLTSHGGWPFPVSYRYFAFPPVREGAVDVPLAPFAPIIAPFAPFVGPPSQTAGLDLIGWDHVATQGRDHYVRVIYEGYLFPFGHRASLVKVTERRVSAPHGTEQNPADSPVAYQRQHMYIVVREHEKSYTGAPYTHLGREMPFESQVTIKTKVTPNIDPPPVGATSFLIDVDGAPYQFHLTARDLAAAEVDFLAPLMFVSLSEADLATVASNYASNNDLRRCSVRGQKVAYADPGAGDTELKTSALYFNAQITSSAPPYPVAPFLPFLELAAVTVPALAELIGSKQAVLIELYAPYLSAGLDSHAGVFADIVGGPPAIGFSADQAGGLARPNLALSALSARKGLVSGNPADAANGVIKPSEFFGDIDAKLFGTIDLGVLIPVDALGQADAATNAPEIKTKAEPNRQHPTELVTKISWEPELTNYEHDPVKISFNTDGEQSALALHVQIEHKLDGSPPTSVATGKLSNFLLTLFGVVDLKIASIEFTSNNGAKSTVALHLAKSNPISFEGPLAFIQQLADILPPGLFGGSGPTIKATSTQLELSITIGLPPITCGVFSLEHIAIMAGLDLPYLDGKPAVEFAFASRARPFLLTVEIFGGGGFVHVVLDADGVKMVEGALEFGANFSLDLGVASGAVHAMAGIYFQLKGTSSELTGFIDIGGEVSVLGIISISIDLNLSLSWLSSPAGNQIRGRATLTVSVHVLFFSASVQLSVERSFSAGGGDPKVGELMNQSEWSAYAEAFA